MDNRTGLGMEPRWPKAYRLCMANADPFQQSPPSHWAETGLEHQERIERERVMIDQAEADINAGLGIDDDDLERWLDDLDRDGDALLPTSRSGSPAPR